MRDSSFFREPILHLLELLLNLKRSAIADLFLIVFQVDIT